MGTIYIANQSVGRFNKGDTVTGLDDKRAEFLASKNIITKMYATKDADAATNLNDLTVAQLKSLLDKQGVEYGSDAKKADLIKLAGD